MQVFVDLCGEGTYAVHVESAATTLGDLRNALLQTAPAIAINNGYSYFSFQGRPLHESMTLLSHSIKNHSTIRLNARFLGGGGDGGATGAESRDCYLNMYATKKPDKVDPNEARLAKWSRCALSSEALKPPCVIDMLGNLYNKEALVSSLLTKSLPKELKYIKGLKDMVTVHLTSVPGISPDDETSHTKFQCPISSQEFNGKYRFFALRGCGHVLSAKALKEVQSSSCLVCFTQFSEEDKIAINGNEEEVLALRQRMEKEAMDLREKKVKKVKNNFSQDSSKDSAVGNVADGVLQALCKGIDEEEGNKKNVVKRKSSNKDKTLVIEKPWDQKLAQSSKRFKAVDIMPENATKEVYASIFSSSSKTKIKETYMCRALPLGRN